MESIISKGDFQSYKHTEILFSGTYYRIFMYSTINGINFQTQHKESEIFGNIHDDISVCIEEVNKRLI